MKWMSLILLFNLLAIGCQNTADAGGMGDTGGGKQPVADDLPKPANETVEMSLNGVRHTLVEKLDCKNGLNGIGFLKSAAAGNAIPTLFLHGADLAATGNITIKSGSNPLAWHMDIDDTGGVWGTEAAGCPGIIVENTATLFELKTIACPIKRQAGVQTGNVSFRVRCTKGT